MDVRGVPGSRITHELCKLLQLDAVPGDDVSGRFRARAQGDVVGRADVLDDGEAVHPGQHSINDQHVERVLRGKPQAALSVGDMVHLVARLAESFDDILRDRGVILDDQNPHSRSPELVREELNHNTLTAEQPEITNS